EELDFDRFDPEPERRDATLLTVQLQYWFELKIPFADGILWRAFSALLAHDAREDEEIHRGRYVPLSARARAAMQIAAADRRGYFVPVVAHATLRMQSNSFARFVRDCSCFEGSRCSADRRAWSIHYRPGRNSPTEPRGGRTSARPRRAPHVRHRPGRALRLQSRPHDPRRDPAPERGRRHRLHARGPAGARFQLLRLRQPGADRPVRG